MENSAVKKKGRDNNFAVLRLTAALMVISGHMGHITVQAVPTLFGRQIQTLGVYIFFLIGGYLISYSFLSDPHPLRYAVKRFMRIWPPLAVFVVFAACVAGPMLSYLSVKEYFSHPGVKNYFYNLTGRVIYFLPGVFASNPYPNAVNGSLWTIPVEVLMYILVPVLLTLTGMKKNTTFSKAAVLLFCVFVCALDCYVYAYHQDLRIVFYDTDWISALHIIPFYFIGVACAIPEIRKYFNLQVAMVLLFVFSCMNMSYVSTQIALYFVMPYLVFSLAFAPVPAFRFLEGKAEISYGLYLYGFFIQQIVVDLAQRFGYQIRFMPMLVISCALTLAAAYLSYYFVERPALAIGKKLLKKIP